MSQEIAQRIEIAHSRINSARERQSTFVQHLADSEIQEEMPCKLEIDGNSVIVKCFGAEVRADPRVTIKDKDEFITEYIFYATVEEQKEEIWRFYLTSNGLLESAPTGYSRICDYDNSYVAKHICIPVVNAVLNSFLFKPTPSING
jgi:hypothetical protein